MENESLTIELEISHFIILMKAEKLMKIYYSERKVRV